MKKGNIPFKNYLILFGIGLFTVLLVFYLASWYDASKEYLKNNSILSEYLSELKSEELNSYLIDNPNIVIYFASAKDEKIKSFEKEFKKLIEEKEVKNDILYVDYSKEENDSFISNLRSIYDKNLNIETRPNLFYIKDAKLAKILYSKDTNINKRDVRNFLIKCGIIGND